jgi:hypothetical protein
MMTSEIKSTGNLLLAQAEVDVGSCQTKPQQTIHDGHSVSPPGDIRWRGAVRGLNLLGLGQTNSVVIQVVNAVPFSEESITKDSQWTNGFGEVHAHERTNARALDIKNVVAGADGEVMAAQGHGQIRE